jgi:hypothetical protein
VGHTRFDAEGKQISQVALSPRKDNLVSMCQRSGEFRPVEIDPLRGGDGLENLLTKLATNYLTLKEDLRLNEALKCYRLSEELPIGLNPPILSTGIETLASSWFESTRSKTAGVYISREEFSALLGEELETAGAKLADREFLIGCMVPTTWGQTIGCDSSSTRSDCLLAKQSGRLSERGTQWLTVPPAFSTGQRTRR